MVLLLLAIAVILPWLITVPSRDLGSLRQLSAVLSELDVAARSGVVDPWRAVPAAEAAPWWMIGRVIRQARCSGFCIVAGVIALQRQVSKAVRRAEQKASFMRLLRMRLSLTICLATLARIFLFQSDGWSGFAGDEYYIGVAAVVSGLATRWFGRYLPRSWVCSQLLEVADWLDGYIRGVTIGTLRCELGRLCRRELREGVDLSREKRRILVAWAQRQGEAEVLQMRRLMEILPLVEILGFGLIASLILAGPALSAWRWTEPEGSATFIE